MELPASEAWTKCNSEQRAIAGAPLLNVKLYNIGKSIRPKVSVGCGCLQWTANRREELLDFYAASNIYAQNDTSLEQLAAIEALFICKEFLDPYYNRILDWCEGQNLNSTIRIITKYYVGQSSSMELLSRLAHQTAITSALQAK